MYNRTDMKSALGSLYRLFIAACLAFGAICIYQLIFLSNERDWDFYIAGAAVDAAAWISELRPPLWSYQLCSGTSRIGDPNGMGVSPLFLFHLVFGPMLGWKILLFLLFIAGFYYCSRCCELMLARSAVNLGLTKREILMISSLLAFYAVSSESYTMRVHSGIIVELLVFLNFGLAYYSYKSLGAELTRRDWIASALIGWAFYSGAAHYSIIFFQVPLAISIGLALGIELMTAHPGERADTLRKIRRVVSVNLLAVLPGLYKILPSYLHLQKFPRGSPDDVTFLPTRLVDLLSFHLFPQLRTGHLAITGLNVYAENRWEVSAPAFSVLPWLVLALCVVLCVRWMVRLPGRAAVPGSMRGWRAQELAPFLLLAIAISFGMGYFSFFAPFKLLNQNLLSHSAHLPIRANHACVFAYAVIAAQLLGCSRRIALGFYRGLGLALAIGAAFNLYAQLPEFPYVTRYGRVIASFIDSVPAVDIDYSKLEKMDRIAIIPEEMHSWPPSLLWLRQGAAVANCHLPIPSPRQPFWALINRAREIALREAGRPADDRTIEVRLPLIADDIGAPSPDCRSRSYFSAQYINLDPACQIGVCLNLTRINPADPIAARLCEGSSPESVGRYCVCR